MADIAVLLSIHPKYCQLIADGEKTIEVRKTRPNIDPPFKCLIYCTKEHNADDTLWIFGKKARDLYGATVDIAHLCGAKDVGGAYKGNGKVVGEFICDNIDCYTDEVVNSSSLEDFCGWNDFDLNRACIHPDDLEKYADGNDLYGWHISDLIIYDKPKELTKFLKPCPHGDVSCFLCDKSGYNDDMHIDCFNRLTRPPQSWCYVEERS